MAKDNKHRTQYNWKFKDNESDEFFQWFNNQDNISSSLRNMVYHMIELYGTHDILDPSIQKQIVKDSLILESLKGQNVFQIAPQASHVDANQAPTPEINTVEEAKATNIKEKKPEPRTLYADIDPNNL